MITSSSLQLCAKDALSDNPCFQGRLAEVDQLLYRSETIERVRFIQQGMVMQLFYVRKWIVGNPRLPNKLRVSALEQLESAMAGLPDFVFQK